MRLARVIRPSAGASACVMPRRWECEQAAPCPAPSAGLSPGPFPICPPPRTPHRHWRWRQLAYGSQRLGSSVTEITNLPLTGCRRRRGRGHAQPHRQTDVHTPRRVWTQVQPVLIITAASKKKVYLFITFPHLWAAVHENNVYLRETISKGQ